MRETNMYQIYDRTAAAAAGPIILEKRDGPALRSFNALLKSGKETLIGTYPTEYELYEIGKQNDETLVIEPTIPPRLVQTGAAWLESQQKEDTLPLFQPRS